jgi:hypothetical protein
VAKKPEQIQPIDDDWFLELEGREISELSPDFEALVDGAMHVMRCGPERREQVQTSLYRALDGFRTQRSVDEMYSAARPLKWLESVNYAAKELAEWIGEAKNPSYVVEMVSDDLVKRFGIKAFWCLESELLRLAAITKERLTTLAKEEEAFINGRLGQPGDHLRQRLNLVYLLMQMIKQCTGEEVRISRHGPMVRFVKEVVKFLSLKEPEDGTIYDWLLEVRSARTTGRPLAFSRPVEKLRPKDNKNSTGGKTALKKR